MNNFVTFTITMPCGAMFDETIDGLKKAKDDQIGRGNIEAAQILHTILVLAQGGKHWLERGTRSPTISAHS
jgi:hypothetical protein